MRLDPTPPPLIRLRLRFRTRRREAVWAIARGLRWLAERLDPPRQVLDRAYAEHQAHRLIHGLPPRTGEEFARSVPPIPTETRRRPFLVRPEDS